MAVYYEAWIASWTLIEANSWSYGLPTDQLPINRRTASPGKVLGSCADVLQTPVLAG